MKLAVLFFILFFLLSPHRVFARVTPNDIYQKKISEYTYALSKVSDPSKKHLVMDATSQLNNLNQTICQRFDIDILRMAAILEEEKRRLGVNKTVVAYGQGNTPLDTAEYYLNYAEEAVAYQKIQDYTPNITSGNLKGGVSGSLANLTSDLGVLQNKVLNAKGEAQKALDYYDK